MKFLRFRFLSVFSILILAVLSGCETNMLVFDPQGPVAKNISDLIIFSIILMAVIVLVVYLLFIVIVWKYRERKDNMDYEPPEEEGNPKLEFVWFVIPVIIIIILMIPTTKAIYDIEDVPEGYEDQEPLVINVTSADWKWIFSYPEQNIETVNYLNIPEDRPVLFKMTSAGTMQSFWVPQLGGQKYTMANMETKLYLVADSPGSYYGRNTNYNGKGYADMEFEVLAQTPAAFEEWVEEVQNTADVLTEEKYAELLEPTVIGRETYNETHLQWVNHAHDGSSTEYLNPDLYEIHHGDEHSDSNHGEHSSETTEHEHHDEASTESTEHDHHEMGGE
ncbi:cytochrome aa3 quinol oxidase subunit II [Radiobacillus sp. PE A8.2]|uniref:cytochrome aa3 quinol oxidase subunit II n=1 Tax=Radiobacillus sp. PE A8.2 TaxID=3380349 RepID=UPI00388E8699